MSLTDKERFTQQVICAFIARPVILPEPTELVHMAETVADVYYHHLSKKREDSPKAFQGPA